MEELSKEIANPLAQIWNLSFQYNYSDIGGNLVDGSEHIQTGLFQPVLPVPLGDKYTAFARPVITYIEGPNEVGITGGTPANPIGQGNERSGEFGDIILPIGFGIANSLGCSWGAGATFIFPTSNNDLLGSHQYQAGPTALALWANEDWMIGGHLQHWWGFADDGESDSNPIIQAAHNKLTLPLAIGIGKMFKRGPMPVMIIAEYQYSVIAPDDIGNESTIMLQANFIIKNPFGSL
jgi:hypothetical protein